MNWIQAARRAPEGRFIRLQKLLMEHRLQPFVQEMFDCFLGTRTCSGLGVTAVRENKATRKQTRQKSNSHRAGSLAGKPNNGENYVLEVVVILLSKYTSVGHRRVRVTVLGGRGTGRLCHHVVCELFIWLVVFPGLCVS